MGILPLKKRINRDKCSFTTKQKSYHMEVWKYGLRDPKGFDDSKVLDDSKVISNGTNFDNLR